ncbi:MAG: hypothetical protein GQ477_04995 [Nanohaloarchaea archaeon]|nr:hypothetical protein [Candidatus Nanohaloarchaea archaeon]
MDKKIVLVALFSLCLLIGVVSGVTGPRVYMAETVSGTDPIYTAGDAGAGGAGGYGSTGAVTRTGKVYVYVPNTVDVLQYVRVNLSSQASSRADIETWTLDGDKYSGGITAYKNYALSYPALTDRTTMYLNTSDDGDTTDDDSSYLPDYDWAPSLNLTMTVVNTAGGDDLYSSDNLATDTNTMNYTFTIRNDAGSGGVTLNGVDLTILFNTDTQGGVDALNITASTVGETSGTSTPSSSDGADGYIDKIAWDGNIAADTTITISFNATMIGGTNYGSNTVNLNVGATDIGARAEYTDAALMTGITVTGEFTRGPVREGVDLVSATPWQIRGFFKNTATSSATGNLTYNVTAAKIYTVNPITGFPIEPANATWTWNYLSVPGTQNYTGYTDGPGDDTKPYIAASFDWYVMWNDTGRYTYSSIINTTMQLPTLYGLDMAYSRSTSDTLSPQIADMVLTIIDTVASNGNADGQVDADNITIISQIPRYADGDTNYRNFTVNATSIKVYLNSTDFELDQASSGLTVTTVQSSAGNNGTITVDIADLSTVDYEAGGAVGRDLKTTESIIVIYDIITKAPLSENGETFSFTGNATLVSQSGTTLTEATSGFSRSASQNSLTGYKELWVADPATPTIVNATINVSVVGAVNDIKFMDYIPADISFSIAANGVMVQNSTDTLVNGTDYYLEFMGYTTLSDGLNVSVWEYRKNATDGWDITNNYIQVGYEINISTGGVYTLPVQIAAFDPIVGQSFETVNMGIVQVYIPKTLEPLTIDDDGTFKLAKSVIVGTPALWIKDFEVYNPNKRSTTAQFSTSVFDDTINAYASYYDMGGEKVEESLDLDSTDAGTNAFWNSKIYAMESRLYTVGVTTPPIISTDKTTEVVEKLDDKKVLVKTDIFLKNLAEEKYTNIKLNTGIGSDNIVSAKDAFGTELEYMGGAATSTIIIPEMEGDGLKTITVIYEQAYPTIIVNPKNDRYDSGMPGYLEILIINGGDKIEQPYLESEIYTQDMELIHLNIHALDNLEPLEKTELSEKFVIPMSSPTGMYIANIKFKDDFTTLAATTGQFYVTGATSTGLRVIETLLLIMAAGVLIFYLRKRAVRIKANKL